MKQRQVREPHVVKADRRVDPFRAVLLQAGQHVGGYLVADRQMRVHVPTLGEGEGKHQVSCTLVLMLKSRSTYN